uniref:Uncharacterized protein n=1 Tax=Pseudo-nitzschia australis TaxID=44445 RepID=A0A7S4EGZ6_9STRA|mmetsp:Transcript_21977/g.46228  ORF Transcript_21977/g.46228 Transcript_21977/m.46228 type:complete len:293 (+) Transcript_21977:281-1159(+)
MASTTTKKTKIATAMMAWVVMIGSMKGAANNGSNTMLLAGSSALLLPSHQCVTKHKHAAHLTTSISISTSISTSTSTRSSGRASSSAMFSTPPPPPPPPLENEYSDFDERPVGVGGDATNTKLSASLPTSNEFSTPEEIVSMCMTCLEGADDGGSGTSRAGLEICYNFSSDSCRMANGGSLESFFQYANNPVFQTMVDCDRWEVLNVGAEIPGTNTRGAMKTVLVHVVPARTNTSTRTNTNTGTDLGTGLQQHQRKDRKFLWTFVKERRPPRQGHFLVHECIAVDNAFAHTE